jgi:hypothetical protein
MLALALIAPPPTYAAAVRQLAGLPIAGDAHPGEPSWTSACHGLAYGKVGGKNVLFTAGHCVGNHGNPPGSAVWDHDSLIGYWTTDPIKHNDFTYIELNANQWPTNRNRIYRGSVPGPDHWEITRDPPWSISCDGVEYYGMYQDEGGNYVYHNWQASVVDSIPYRYGQLLSPRLTYGANGECHFKTTLETHWSLEPAENWVDSGSPFVIELFEDTVFGVAKGYWTNQVTGRSYLTVAPFYDYLRKLKNYWGSSARLCHVPDCSS